MGCSLDKGQNNFGGNALSCTSNLSKVMEQGLKTSNEGYMGISSALHSFSVVKISLGD